MSLNVDLNEHYNQQPKISANLERAWKFESKTRQLPFVVAQELDSDGSSESASRHFLIFNDLEHFLYQRKNYPHTHEIIRCPMITHGDEVSYRDDSCKGRLIFDFDLEKPLSVMKIVNMDNPNTFVPHNFTYLIEEIILETFRRYYKIDVSKLKFGWQYSPNPKKFSMHLIVKHAYFSEYWTQQMKGFYTIFKYVAAEMDLTYLMEAIDWQIARRNGTFRMIDSSKIGGQALKLISYRNNGEEILKKKHPSQVKIQSLLCGIYDFKTLKKEQHISMDKIKYVDLTKTLESGTNPGLEQGIQKYLNLDNLRPETICRDEPTEENYSDLQAAIELFEKFNEDGAFQIRTYKGNLIGLQRLKASPCPISEVIHEHENPFLLMTKTGYLVFRCRRGCKNQKGMEGHVIGFYNKSYLEENKPTQSTEFKKVMNFNTDQITPKVKVEMQNLPIITQAQPHVNINLQIDHRLIDALKNCKVVKGSVGPKEPDPKTGKPSGRVFTIATKYKIDPPKSLLLAK